MGRNVVVTCKVTQGPVDGGDGGGTVPFDQSANYAQAEGETHLPLVDANVPVSLRVPIGGARVIAIRVIKAGDVLPTLILTSAAGIATIPVDGLFVIRNPPDGRSFTSVEVKGVCEIGYGMAG